MDLANLSPTDLLHLKAAVSGMTLDANEVALLDRQLRHVEEQIYLTEYPELRHTRYIPQDTSTPVGAESIAYRVMDQIQQADLISDYATDLPNVDVILSEVAMPIKGYGNSYMYSLRDLQHASFSGVMIDSQRAQASRDSIERKLDNVATFGESSVGLKGFVNNDGVDILTVATEDGDTTWAEKKVGDAAAGSGSAAIIADLSTARNHVIEETNQLYRVDTILMATELFNLINTTPFSVAGGSDRTILEWFRANNPEITIEGWHQLDAAAADGSSGRIVSYFRDPRVLVEKAVMPYNQLPPQAKSLAFIVNAWTLTGGTHIYRPKAVVYMDGAN